MPEYDLEGCCREMAVLVAAFDLFHVQVKASVLGGCFAVKPVGPQLTGASDAAPISHQTPISKETGHDPYPVEPVQVGVWLFEVPLVS